MVSLAGKRVDLELKGPVTSVRVIPLLDVVEVSFRSELQSSAQLPSAVCGSCL